MQEAEEPLHRRILETHFEMQKEAEEPLHRRMAEGRLALELEVRLQRERAGLAASSFGQSLRAIRSMPEENLANRDKLTNLKDHLNELEVALGENLAEKTCKEAKCTSIVEALSTSTDRTKQLKKIVQDQRARKNEYAAVISQQLLALETLEEKSSQYITEKEEIDKAIMWYCRVLGFRTEGGEGVRFIFDKIGPKSPHEEYSFIIRLDGDIYTLLHCNPHLDDIGELVKDLNVSNGLFKFVRVMREKFKSAALNGVLPTAPSIYPEPSLVTISSPPPTSVDSCEISIKQNGSHLQPKLGRSNHPQKSVRGQISSPSPQSLSALRRSPCLMVNKFA